MSGGTKQQFKQFSITCAEDACLVLGMLISGMTVNLEKYKEYASEAESLLESTQEEYVPAKEYDDVNDKLLYRQREILKFTADHQSSSFSYIRKKIPPCKLVMLCDENSAPDIAREVANAKKDGLIDAFFYSSVTEKYLTAALASL